MVLANGALVARRDHKDGGIDLVVSFDGDDDYSAGGTSGFTAFVEAILKAVADAATPSNVRGGQSLTIISVDRVDCGQYMPHFVYGSDKLFCRDGGHATWDEVADTTDLSSTSFIVSVKCR